MRAVILRPVILCPALLIAAALAVTSAAPASANIVVTIDKTTQRMAVSVDGTERYVWPVSTGRAGYDTPNGTFKPNRMDADHLSQEWDNAPMPHTIFFDLHGHAVHGFFDVKHLGLPVSHGCVRLSPDHAATLFDLVKAEGMKDTTVIVSGQTPGAEGPAVARRNAPVQESVAEPMQIAPSYGEQPPPYSGQQQQYYRQPAPYYVQQQQPQPYYARAQQPYQQAQPYGAQQWPSQPPPPPSPFRPFN
jgi:hypothetical protein